MMRTVLPAVAQAVVMHSSPNFHHERTVESLKDELQVLHIMFEYCDDESMIVF